MITDLVAYINRLIQEDKLYKFYKSREWRQLRQEVLDDEHNECVNCREKYGRITAAVTVHHVNHVKDRPDLALSRYYTDINGEQQPNLVALCGRCHNEVHPEKIHKANNKKNKKKEKINDEKW